jgi:hypothetical protein
MKALRTLVLAETTITDLIDDRIYINKIPRADIEAADTLEPPKILVLRMAGGGSKADVMPTVDLTVDALCYGETDFEADKLRRAVTQRFTLLSRETHDDVLIHHINPTGGPISSVDPDLVWPAVAQSFTILADILEVP